MNKAMRKVLALGVAAMMLLSTATAFAADGLEVSTSAGSADNAAYMQMPGRAVSKQAFGKLPSGAKIIKAESNKATTLNYDTDSPVILKAPYDANQSGHYTTYPFTSNTSGKMYVYAYPSDSNASTKDITIVLGTTSDEIINIQKSMILKQSQMTYAFGGIDVVQGKEYSLGIGCQDAGELNVGVYVYSYAERNLTEGTWMISSGARGSSNAVSTVTYKVIAPKTGYMDVYLDAAGRSANTTGKVTLLNKSRRAVSSTLSFNKASKTGYAVFGVKKGATYYIKVAGCTGTAAEQFVYGVKYKVTAGKKRSNTKRSRSITLKRKGKAVKTVIPANGKSGKGWYKFKVTKKRKTQIRVNATNVKSGSLKITVYCGKKKVATAKVVKGKINTFTVTHSTTWGKAKRGTYYAVITKSAKANGQYSVKFLR